MVRRLLVPLDPSPSADVALQHAIRIARRREAEITVLGLLDEPGIEKAVGPGTPATMDFVRKAEKRKLGESHDEILAMYADAEKAAVDAGVSIELLEIQDDPFDAVVRESLFHDLLVTGLHTHYKYQTSDAEDKDKAVRKMIARIGTPILAVTPELPAAENPRVVAAVGGSFASVRSLRRFVAIEPFAEPRVTLVTSGPDREKAADIQEKVLGYLTAHGIHDVTLDWTPEEILPVIRDQYVPTADLIVVGTHTKTNWFDFAAIGSLTNYLIDDGETALFIGQ